MSECRKGPILVNEKWRLMGGGVGVGFSGKSYHSIYINAVVGFGARKANEDNGKILMSKVWF